MTEVITLFAIWLACSFALGVFVGRFIQVGSHAAKVVPFEPRRASLQAATGRQP